MDDVLNSFRASHTWDVSSFVVDLYVDPNDGMSKPVDLTQWMTSNDAAKFAPARIAKKVCFIIAHHAQAYDLSCATCASDSLSANKSFSAHTAQQFLMHLG